MVKKNDTKESDYHLIMQPEKFKNDVADKVAEANLLLETAINSQEDFKKIKKKHASWKDYIKEYLKRAFSNATLSEEFASSSSSWSIPINPSFERLINDFQDSFEKEISYLDSLIARIDLIPSGDNNPKDSPDNTLNNNVFIVHGQKDEIKMKVARFIEQMKLRPIILDEQANEGKTIIEKFEYYSSTCRTAIVILTADDKVLSVDGNEIKYRARQNVILELGYFLSSLKREGIIVLYEDNVEIPSDFYGVLYISLKEEWKLKMARELKKRGLNIDLNDLMG